MLNITSMCFSVKTRAGFQRQLVTNILHSIILDSETFHDNLFFTIVTAAIDEIQLNYKKYAYFEML